MIPRGNFVATSGKLSSHKRTYFGMATLVAMTCASLMGCAGYRFGAASLYPPEIRTVHVPIFESNSYRRNLGEWLTEAVIREIELKTPYKVVSHPNADSVLTGTIIADTKRILVVSPTDEPRETEMRMEVQVSWVDRRGNVLRERAGVPIPPELIDVAGTGSIVPEFGQSVVTAQQDSIEQLAQQIVSLMEAPW